MEKVNTGIDSFKARFYSVRPTLFKIQLPITPENKFLENKLVTTQNADWMYIYCNAAKLPASKIDEKVSYYLGRPLYEAGDRSFDTLELNFRNSQDFGIRTFIETWMEHINKRMENVQIKDISYDYFLPELKIHQLNRRNEIIKTYKFFYCFPIESSEIPLDYAATDEIEEFVVIFRYQYWQEESASDKESSVAPSRQSFTQETNIAQSGARGSTSRAGNSSASTVISTAITLVKSSSNTQSGLGTLLSTVNSIPISLSLSFLNAQSGAFNIAIVHNDEEASFTIKAVGATKIGLSSFKDMLSDADRLKIKEIDFSKFSIYIVPNTLTTSINTSILNQLQN